MRILLVASLLLTGCATLANTPQQDYVWELSKACNTRQVFMHRVNSDGSYTIWTRENAASSYPAYHACIREQAKARPYQAWQRANGR